MSNPESETQSTTTPAPQQSHLTLLLLAMLVVVALLFAYVISKNGLFKANDSDKLSQLRSEVATLEAEARNKGISLPTHQDSIDEIAKRISRDTLALTDSVSTIQQALSTKDSSVSALQRDLDAAITTNERLAAESNKLRQQLHQANANHSDTPALLQEIETLKLELADKNASIAKFSNRPTPALVKKLQEDLDSEILKNTEFQDKIAALEEQVKEAAPPKELNLLEDQLATLVKENQELSQKLQKFYIDEAARTLFVKSADKLSPNAGKLFAELNQLEGMNSNQLAAAYTRINEKLNTHVGATIQFPANSSEVSGDFQTKIKEALKESKPESTFLVVGYASKSGIAGDNQKLSSDRATATAAIVNQLKQSGQKVQAVYLGQTNRFSGVESADSSPSVNSNQVCEIWEIQN